MLRTVYRAVTRTAPRRAIRSRGFAAHAEHAEQIVVEGKPTKEWLAERANVEHHADGSYHPSSHAAHHTYFCLFCRNNGLMEENKVSH